MAATLELKEKKENAHSDCIRSVAYSPDGTKIVSCGVDQTIRVWDAGAFWGRKMPLLRPELTPPMCA